MRFEKTPLIGAYVIEIEEHRDERGFFARTYCRDEFRRLGLEPNVAQSSVSFNQRRGTLRGMHFQEAPHAEVRVVRCTRGRIFDVIVDLRSDSADRGRWYGAELSAENHRALYVPKGFAHGFQTLEDRTEVLYDISVPYAPEATRGYHYASPAFGIDWPLPPADVSERDQQLDSLDG
ncbi:MAG: dTDP-4-dehydrorhamnose 3,5-epimerase [bacterium]|nr:dTDP-4-dehydrorhamnose 3,5-epimerase [bacterium]